MKANYLDFRKKMKDIIKALELNETVELYYRGKQKGILTPVKPEKKKMKVEDHPAFGMWKGRKDMKEPSKYVRKIREPRYDI